MNNVFRALGLSVLLGACSFANGGKGHLQSDLPEILAAYAAQNELSMEEVREELASLTWNAEYSSKGGAGMIASGTYVDVLAPENVIVVDGARWVGEQADTVEVVFVVDGHVTPEVGAAAIDRAVMVIFTPTYVRFINADGNWAGKYQRANAGD